MGDLLQALHDATGGEKIGLDAAGDWSRIDLGNSSGVDLLFASEVTIQSADPGQQTKIGELLLRDASNITFENIEFDYTFSPGDDWRDTPFEIHDSSGVTIRNSLFDGDVGFTGDPATDGFPTGHGLRIYNSADVTLESNEITGWARGMKIHGSSEVVVRDNDFHHQRMDHMVVSEMTGLLIENNLFRDHVAAPDSGDHRDMIQMWSDGTVVPTSDVTIRSNVFMLNEAEWGSQTLFLQNRVVDNGDAGEEMFYRDFVITDNVIVNGHKHAIKLGSIDGALIANNTILRDDVADGDGVLQTPRIDIESGSRNVTVARNVVSELRGYEGQADWTVADNVFVQDDDLRQENHYSDMFINAGRGTRSDLANIQTLPGSVIEALGAGAAMLAYQATPESLTALFRGVRDADTWSSFDFDAGYSAGPDGQLSAEMASFSWDFGDGTTASGATVSHDYAQSGDYTVTLTVTDEDGASDVSTTRIEVGDPEVLRFEEGAGGLLLDDDTVLPLPDDLLSEDGKSLTFHGVETRQVIDKSLLSDLTAAREISLDVTLKSEDWSTGAGEVMRLHKGFVLSVTETGHARFVYYADDGPRVTLDSAIALADGAWTQLGIRADAAAGTLQLMIDGQPAGQAAIGGGLSADLSEDLSLGSAWSGNGFTGEISQLRLSADENRYDTEQTPPEETPPNLIERLAEAGRQATLQGNATLEESGGVRLDGDGDWIEVGNAALETINATGPVTIEIGYQRDEADGGTARLAWLHQRLGLETVDDGLAVRVRTAGGELERFVIRDLGLNDTTRHTVRLEIDDDEDYLSLAVDDEIVFQHSETDLMLDDPDLNQVWDWRVGGAWNNWFDGVIDDFQITVEAPGPFASLVMDPLALGALAQDIAG